MRAVFRMSSQLSPCLVLVAALFTTGCGERPQGSAPPAQPSEASFKEVGQYQLHFNALRTDTLKPEVARAFGIERSKNRVMLNVAVLHKDPAITQHKAVEATVLVTAHNLTGQLKPLTIRRVNEGDAIYYIGETSISGAEILVFDIKATPVSETTSIDVQLRREFFSD